MTSRASHLPARPDAPEPRPERLRLVVVDADDRTRESMVGLLGIRGRFRVVASAGNAVDALAAVRAHRPDVVILDPRLLDRSCAALIRSIRALEPRVHLLAASRSPELEGELLGAGADAFVRKTFRPTELADAITQCVDAGPRHVSLDIPGATAAETRDRPTDPAPGVVATPDAGLTGV